MLDIERVLVPVDFSTCSRRALEFAVPFAARLGAAVEVLHAYRPPDGHVPWVTVTTHGEPKRTVHELARSEAARGLDELLQAALPASCPRPKTLLIPGEPAEVIIARASLRHPTLIVMGTRGRTGLAHWLLGSVAEKVVRRAPCPVLTVPPARLTIAHAADVSPLYRSV